MTPTAPTKSPPMSEPKRHWWQLIQFPGGRLEPCVDCKWQVSHAPKCPNR
jgi:hypothetical protein